MKVSKHLRSDLIKIECFTYMYLYSLTLDVSSFKTTFFLTLFPVIWFYCIIFYILLYNTTIIVLYGDLLFYSVYSFLKWKMIKGYGFTAISCFIFVPKNWWLHLYKLFIVYWLNYLSNRRLVKVTSHSVWEIRKITEFLALLLVKSCLPPVDTLKEISNE